MRNHNNSNPDFSDFLSSIKTDADVSALAYCFVGKITGRGAAKEASMRIQPEGLLFASLIALLRDWFDPKDYSISGLITLLDIAENKEKDADFKSPLDYLFEQIETGKRYIEETKCIEQYNISVVPCDATDNTTYLYYVPSKFKHNTTGVKPGDVGGLSDKEDFALANYNAFMKAAPIPKRGEVIANCRTLFAPLTSLNRKRARLINGLTEEYIGMQSE